MKGKHCLTAHHRLFSCETCTAETRSMNNGVKQKHCVMTKLLDYYFSV